MSMNVEAKETDGASVNARSLSVLSKEMVVYLQAMGDQAGMSFQDSEEQMRELLDRLARTLGKVREQVSLLPEDSEPLERELSVFSTAFEQINEGIVVTDSSPRILLANPAAERILGRSLPRDLDLRNRIVLPFTHADGLPYTLQDLPNVWAVYHGEPVVNAELVFHRPGEKTCRIVVHCIPLLDIEKEVTGAVTIIQKISERVAMHRAEGASRPQKRASPR
jgi:PAS domain S-box-containing protein